MRPRGGRLREQCDSPGPPTSSDGFSRPYSHRSKRQLPFPWRIWVAQLGIYHARGGIYHARGRERETWCVRFWRSLGARWRRRWGSGKSGARTSKTAAMAGLGPRGEEGLRLQVCSGGRSCLLWYLSMLKERQRSTGVLQWRRIDGGDPRPEAGKMHRGARSWTSLVQLVCW